MRLKQSAHDNEVSNRQTRTNSNDKKDIADHDSYSMYIADDDNRPCQTPLRYFIFTT